MEEQRVIVPKAGCIPVRGELGRQKLPVEVFQLVPDTGITEMKVPQREKDTPGGLPILDGRRYRRQGALVLFCICRFHLMSLWLPAALGPPQTRVARHALPTAMADPVSGTVNRA
jgi:hypothetical protein